MLDRISKIALLGCALTVLCVPSAGQESEATKWLKARHAHEFDREVIRVAKNVYTAIGYQVSANSMIIGDNGVIIVDPGQAPPMARPVAEAFRKLAGKPVVAIIYTHSHGDHANAARAFVDDPAGVQVWATSKFGSESRRLAEAGLQGGARPVNTQGFDLLPEQRIGIGIAIPPERPPRGNMMVDGRSGGGDDDAADRGRPPGQLEPTHTFSEPRRRLEIAGVTLELVAAPGETDDQLYVWLPEQKVLFAGDNFYKSWPNTYPLRGTARRSTRDWIESLSKMIGEEPKHLVGGHTRPILNDAVAVLTNYRDALQYVYDQTIEGAKAYKTPDELVAEIQLPDHLAELDYLGDYYGSIEGTIRDIYAQDLGWFDGDPLTLHRESPRKQSERIAGLAGGVDALLAKARALMAADDALGAAQLLQHVVRLRPTDKPAKLLMADALAVVGERTFNAPARNYTLAYSNLLRREAMQ